MLSLLFLVGCNSHTSMKEPRVSNSTVGGGDYNYSKITVDSVKNSLHRISGEGLFGTYLFREIFSSSFVGAIEGHQGKIILELWDFENTQSPRKMLWRIEQDSDKWYFEKGVIVFLKRGCCGSLDKHYHYKVSNGELIKITEHQYKRRMKNESVFIFPG